MVPLELKRNQWPSGAGSLLEMEMSLLFGGIHVNQGSRSVFKEPAPGFLAGANVHELPQCLGLLEVTS